MYVKPYFQRELVAPLPDSPSDIAEYPTQLAPTLIEAVITRSARAFWKTDLDHERGLNAINQYCIEVLMGAKNDIIREVRGTRGGYYDATYSTDVAVTPVGTYPGASMNDILLSLSASNEEPTVRALLLEQRDLLIEIRDGTATEEGLAEIISRLGTIATLLA